MGFVYTNPFGSVEFVDGAEYSDEVAVGRRGDVALLETEQSSSLQ